MEDWMKKSLALALLSVAAARLAAQTPGPAPTPLPVTVLRASRVFDETGDRVMENAVVVIEGSKIKAVGAGLPVPSGATVLDLGDATLLPGFIDSHTHITEEASDNWLSDFYQGLRRTAPEQTLLGAVYARRTLDAGFTTVRNVGAEKDEDIGLRNGIARGLVPGPRILASRYALGATGGHCDQTGFPEHTFGSEPGPERGVFHGADEGRQAVRLQIKYGADVIKMCASGGVLSLGDDVSAPQLTEEELTAVIDEAHRLKRKTAAHAHGDLAARTAVKAGIDSIEHGSFLSEETLQLMKAKGTYLVPTLLAGEYTGGKAAKFPPEIAAKAKAAFAARSDMFRRALKVGVKIAFGTDSAVSPHGINAQEFGLMVGLGMSPAAALRTAGPAAADLLGLSKEIGTLEAGKEADIVAVPGNPLSDIHATEKVLFVMKGGKVFKNDSKGVAR
jgi:imidazolonepropionase-like amidohydrolase